MKENIKIIGNPVGYEVDQEKTKMLLKKKILPIKQWKDLVDNKISVGNSVYIISSSSIIVDYSGTRRFNEYDKDCFIDRNYANASMALSQISQLMPYYGGKVTNEEWNDGKISKYCIERKFDGRGGHSILVIRSFTDTYHTLAFHSYKHAYEFLMNNSYLINDLFMK